jgi:UDP-glucose 4-epimerase
MKVAIIGANGFLGRNLVLKFLLCNEQVWAFYNERADKIPSGCIPVNVKDIRATEVAFDVLIISIGSHASSHHDFIEQQLSILNILKSARFKRVIYFSSIAVYGNHTDVIRINSAYQCPGLYGQSKLATEFIISGQENFAIIRPTYIYGNGMNVNSLIPAWVNSALSKKRIEVYGNGSRKQDYLHVDDAVDLCYKACISEEKFILIAATGRSVTNREVAEMIQQYVKDGIEIVYKGTDSAASFSYDIEETIKKLDWNPRIDFADGIKEYIEHESACV